MSKDVLVQLIYADCIERKGGKKRATYIMLLRKGRQKMNKENAKTARYFVDTHDLKCINYYYNYNYNWK